MRQNKRDKSNPLLFPCLGYLIFYALTLASVLLLGAPFDKFEEKKQTLFAAFYLTIFSFIVPVGYLSNFGPKQSMIATIQRFLLDSFQGCSKSEVVLCSGALTSVLLAWVASILIPLENDTIFEIWPNSILIGASVGAFVGYSIPLLVFGGISMLKLFIS